MVQYLDDHACKGTVLAQSWYGIAWLVPFLEGHCHVTPLGGFHSMVRPLVLP